MPLPPEEKTMVFELTRGIPFAPATDGSSDWFYYPVDVIDLERFSGRAVESLQVLGTTQNRQVLHQWAVFVTWQNIARAWATPVQISADFTANGETVGDLYTTTTNFAGRRWKFLIGAKPISGTSRIDAFVRAWVVIRFRS